MRRALVAGALAAAATAATASAGSYSPPPGDHQPVWSPDGTAIVYLARSEGARSLRVMAPDGSGNRRLPLPALLDVGPTPFAFSPDWFWVAFGGNELILSRPDGSNRHRLSDSVFGTQPTWSPDGRRLAFPRSDGLYVADADGSNVRRVATAGGWNSSWSPDGELIAFTGGPVDATEIVLVRPDGSGERVLTEHLPGSHRAPTWSPDGGALAFLTNVGGEWRVTLLTRDGELIVQVDAPYFAPSLSWSPDGGRLLLSSVGVWVYDVQTRRLRVAVPFGSEAVWSPAGDAIAFAGGGECKDRSGIYRARADGTAPVRLTNDCRIVGTPGADRLEGTELADVLLGLEGDDFLGAYDPFYAGDDLYGGPGADTLTGHFLGDRLEGGPGADRIQALAGPDFLRGGPGRDLLQGGGGKDYVDAEDGARDVVACGTNRSRATGPEQDTAFVDRLDRVSGCELLYRNGRADLRPGRTALAITSNLGGADSTWTLRCRPAGGTLPRAAAACRRLAAMRGPLAPASPAGACAPLVRTAGARVRGLFAGRRVTVAFDRGNDCEVARWDRHRFLLQPR